MQFYTNKFGNGILIDYLCVDMKKSYRCFVYRGWESSVSDGSMNWTWTLPVGKSARYYYLIGLPF